MGADSDATSAKRSSILLLIWIALGLVGLQLMGLLNFWRIGALVSAALTASLLVHEKWRESRAGKVVLVALSVSCLVFGVGVYARF